MKSIKVKSCGERADELLRDPEAYFESVRLEAQAAVRASMLRRQGRRRWLKRKSGDES
jgi:hypothetical protein